MLLPCYRTFSLNNQYYDQDRVFLPRPGDGMKPHMLFSCPSNMKRELWLLAWSRTISEERMKHD
jgi:hypothetical protein